MHDMPRRFLDAFFHHLAPVRGVGQPRRLQQARASSQRQRQDGTDRVARALDIKNAARRRRPKPAAPMPNGSVP